MELFDDFGQTRKVTLVETQLAQLREEEEREDYRTRKEEGEDGEREEGEREDYRGEQERRRGRMGKEEK